MRDFQPNELASAIAASRAALPTAIDALCTTIAEVNGVAPERNIVEHVGRFWLLHLCDQWSNLQSDDTALAHDETTRSRVLVPQHTRLTFDSIANRAKLMRQLSGVDSMQLLNVLEHFDDRTHVTTTNRRQLFLSRIGSRGAEVAVSLPYLKISSGRELMAAIRSRRMLRWAPEDFPPLRQVPLASDQRVSVAKVFLQSSDEYRELRAVVALMAPRDLVEHHAPLQTWARKLREHARLFYTANAQHVSTSFMHRTAAARMSGSKLLVHQHGGGYGVDERHPGEDHDVAISDYFYTFGWRREDHPETVLPLPAAMPERRKGRTRGILLMSLPVTNELYRLQSFCVPSHVQRAVNLTADFVGALSDGTTLTMRHSGADRFPMNQLSGAKAAITQDEGFGRGTIAASRASLVVHNYLGTSWLETLAMDVPTVCFYDPAYYRPREAAQPFLDALARVGVLHYSGLEAAKFVNALRGDPTAWWRSAEVQEAREAFVARYANFSDNWLSAWTQEFERLLS